jgi:hypothetical protein
MHGQALNPLTLFSYLGGSFAFLGVWFLRTNKNRENLHYKKACLLGTFQKAKNSMKFRRSASAAVVN